MIDDDDNNNDHLDIDVDDYICYVSTITASNYSGSNNDAAIMIIEVNSTNPIARPIINSTTTPLTYYVHHFKTSSADSGTKLALTGCNMSISSDNYILI